MHLPIPFSCLSARVCFSLCVVECSFSAWSPTRSSICTHISTIFTVPRRLTVAVAANVPHSPRLWPKMLVKASVNMHSHTKFISVGWFVHVCARGHSAFAAVSGNADVIHLLFFLWLPLFWLTGTRNLALRHHWSIIVDGWRRMMMAEKRCVCKTQFRIAALAPLVF